MSESKENPKRIGEILTEVVADFQRLVRSQIDLTVAELKDSAKAALRSSVLVITAITLFIVAALMLVVALGFGLAALGLPYWLAFVLDALIFIIIGGILLAIAARNAKSVKMPTVAMDNLEETVNDITESVSRSKLVNHDA